MSTILVLCNTYYQLITAIQMKYTVFKEDEVSLVLSDHSRNADIIVKKINNSNIFKECSLIKTKKEISTKSIISIVRSIKQGILGVQNYSILKKKYDFFIYYNYECITYSVFNTLLKQNSNLFCSRFEEGVLTYDFIDQKIKKILVVEKIRKVLSKKLISDYTRDFYCFYPEVYNGKLNPIKVPKIEFNSEVSKLLKNIFELDKSKSYNEKYIFFTSVYDFEGGTPIGEEEIVRRVAQVVGKENLLIKVHPRDTRGIYENDGFNVDKNSAIPWEAIQISFDFSDKIFITTTSGSVLAGSFLSEKPVKTFYMYKLCNSKGNSLAFESINTINRLLNDSALSTALDNVIVPDEFEQIIY